jgi:hypothetical protein
MSCHDHAVLQETSQDYGTERHGHGISMGMVCVNWDRPSRHDMWPIRPRSAPYSYHAEFHEGCYQKHTNPLNCRASSSDISGYHTDFHEGHGTVGEWQGRGMTCLNSCGTAWQGNGTGAAWHVWISLKRFPIFRMKISPSPSTVYDHVPSNQNSRLDCCEPVTTGVSVSVYSQTTEKRSWVLFLRPACYLNSYDIQLGGMLYRGFCDGNAELLYLAVGVATCRTKDTFVF